MHPKDNSETETILSRVSYFQGLDPSVFRVVVNASVRRSFPVNHAIIVEGEMIPGLFVIISGWLKAVKTGLDGREQVLQVLGPGEVFHAIGVFTDSPSPASIIALEDCQLVMIQRSTMQKLLEEQPFLAKHVINDLAGRVLHLVSLVEDLSLRSVEARLARLLLDQAKDGVILRKRWATQEEMARRVGTVPDVLNRLLRKLVDAGIVKVDRQQIHILNREKLQEIACVP